MKLYNCELYVSLYAYTLKCKQRYLPEKPKEKWRCRPSELVMYLEGRMAVTVLSPEADSMSGDNGCEVLHQTQSQ